jgi:chromosome segregation ATPase
MRLRPIAVLLLCAAAARPALARAGESPTEARLRDALRAATAQLRAAEDEKARLQASEAALQAKISALEAKLAAAAKPRGNPRAEAELRVSLDEKTAAAAKLAEDVRRCEASLRDANDGSHAREQERAQLAAQVGPMGERLATCEKNNAELYRVGREILDRYARTGLYDVLAAREPFVGARRVELQNLAQDYADKLLDRKVNP